MTMNSDAEMYCYILITLHLIDFRNQSFTYHRLNRIY